MMMAFVPASFEIFAFFLFAPYVLGITRVEAAVMGAVLGAVSPAVVIPRMVQLMENGYGTQKSIPQMIMAGASCDDIFVIVLFTTFVRMAQGGSAKASDFVQIPISIVLGVVLGAAAGYVLAKVFETAYAHAHCVRNSMKVILVLGLSFLLMAVETWLKGTVPVSGLLAVVSMACMLKANVCRRFRSACLKIRQALAGSGSRAVCVGRRGGRYPVYSKRWCECTFDDRDCAPVSCSRRILVHGRDAAK